MEKKEVKGGGGKKCGEKCGMRVVSGKKSAVKKSNEPRGVRVWRTRVLWRACVFQFVCVCVCALCIHCHAHASATVWRHKGGVLVNGTLVGAPRRRRGEQHVEKGSSCVDVHPRATLHPFRSPFGQFGPWSFKKRPRSSRCPSSSRPRAPRIASHPSAARNWMNVAFDFRHPFQREIRIWESLNGRNVSPCGGFWKGDLVRGEGGIRQLQFLWKKKNSFILFDVEN